MARSLRRAESRASSVASSVERPGESPPFGSAHLKVPFPALEVGRLGQAEQPPENLVFVLVQCALHLRLGPQVELAFLALGIGIQGGVVAACRVLHLAHDPLGGLVGNAREERLSGCRVGVGQHGQQFGIVVEHLLEMGDFPALVHRVAEEAAGEMIVQAALGHSDKREGRHAQRLIIALQGLIIALQGLVIAVPALLVMPQVLCRGEAPPGPQQRGDMVRMGELGRAAEAAVFRVEGLSQPLPGGLKRRQVEFHRLIARDVDAAQRVAQRVATLVRLLAIAAIVALDPGKNLLEDGCRKIGAGQDRQLLRGQEYRQRPAACRACGQLVRGLVDLVDVRALFPVDLDVDVEGVHQPGGGLVLKRLVRHDVAPVAGGVADGQQDGLVLIPRPLKRSLVPGQPVHRVVGVLQQVGTGFVGELVGHGFDYSSMGVG